MDDVIRKHMRTALKRLIKKSDVLWPSADEQLAEKNLSLYAGHELLRRGYTVITEWPLNRNEHIDLVAWSPAGKTLVLLESKRTWRRSLELNWLYNDVKRLEKAARKLGAWTLHAVDGWQNVEPQAIVGVVLLGSNDEKSLDPDKRRRGKVNDVIRGLIQKVGHFFHVLIRMQSIRMSCTTQPGQSETPRPARYRLGRTGVRQGDIIMAGELFSDRATNESHTCQIWQILVGCAARRETLCGSFRTMPLVQAQA